MDINKAIPDGLMTVGTLAKKMNITVRTLQYYDKEKILSPTSESIGGRRLYDEKAMIKLYQILSLKSLGMSLDDIKKSIYSLDTPEEVAKMLSEQEIMLEDKIKNLTNSLKEIKVLKNEVIQMKKVDFKKYSDIITNLEMKNDFYWLIKHFDDKTMDQFRKEYSFEKGSEVINKCNQLYEIANNYAINNVEPNCDEALEFAKKFWTFVLEFTKGDMNLINKLMNLTEEENNNEELKEKQKLANDFIGKSLENYFIKNNINPLEEKKK